MLTCCAWLNAFNARRSKQHTVSSADIHEYLKKANINPWILFSLKGLKDAVEDDEAEANPAWIQDFLASDVTPTFVKVTPRGNLQIVVIMFI